MVVQSILENFGARKIRLPMDCEVAVPKKPRVTVLGFESVSVVTLGVYRFLLVE